MGRHKPWVELSPCQTICIRNAKAHINYGIKTVYYENESSFETIRPPSEQTRRKKAAYEVLQKWKEPGASVPLGVARYFLQDTKFMLVAEQLGVLDLFKSIQDEHLATCPNHCIALVHPGQFIPDCGSIAMIATTSSSFANFSAVVLTAPVPDEPRTVGEGPSSSFKSSPSSPSLSFSVSEDFNIHRLDSALPMDIEQMISDLEVDDFLERNPEFFLPERLKWLGTSSSLLHTYTFVRLLQHWATSEDIPQAKMTRLLSLLHTFRPTLSRDDYDDLPKSGRSLLTIPLARRKFCNANRQITPIYQKRVLRPDQHIGNYLHFGLEGAITGKSSGLTHRFHYRNLLRRIHTVHPLLLPDQFLKLTEPDSDEPYDRQTWVNWLLKKEGFRTAEPLVFEIRINVDGVQWFLSSTVKGIPILAKIVAVRSLSGKTHVKVPYHIAKPFVIGIYEQKKDKPTVHQLMGETIEEMKRLHPDSLMPGEPRENESFAVEVKCFCCDDPMRRELKGIKFSGSFSCERCHVKGVYLDKLGREVIPKAKPTTRKQMDAVALQALKAAKAALKKSRIQARKQSGKVRRGGVKKGGTPLLANPRAVAHGIKKKKPAKPSAAARPIRSRQQPGTVVDTTTIVAERDAGAGSSNNPNATALKVLRVSHKGSTYFPEQDSELRTDEKWHEYKWRAIPSEKNSAHRPELRFSCFDDPTTGKQTFVFRMISGFILDPMHLLDGGVIKDFFKHVLERIREWAPRYATMKAQTLTKLQDWIEQFNKSKILETCTFRSVDPKVMCLWKMREYHVTFMYLAFPLFTKFQKVIRGGEQIMSAMKHLLLAMHLTKGFSSDPVPEEVLIRSQTHFKLFFHDFRTCFGDKVATSKVHGAKYLTDDMRTNDCHADYLSAYDFEGAQQQWGGNIRSGNQILPQVDHRYEEKREFSLPIRLTDTGDQDDETMDELGATPQELEHMVKNRTLELPPNLLRRRIKKSSQFTTLEYVGFRVRDKFPNNIVLLKNGSIMIVTSIVTEQQEAELTKEGETIDAHYIAGHLFEKATPLFKTPYDSREIGFFNVTKLEVSQYICDATDVHSKCGILSNALKPPGTTHEPDGNFVNPLPETLKEELHCKHRTNESVLLQYHASFPNGVPTWTVFSLLLPANQDYSSL